MSLLKVAVPAAAAAVAAAVWWRHWRRAGSKLGGDAAVGVIGLGVMGAQLLMNLAEKLETPIAGLDMDDGKAKAAIELAQSEGGLPVCTFTDTAAFVAALRKPRVVLLLVPAGRAVDGACAALSKLLEAGDLVVDMGNEHFELTEARQAAFHRKGVHFMGCGTSGGEKGARYGPCLMPGGPLEGWRLLEPLLTKIAARVDGGKTACVAHIGPGGSGHFVKMVHNGIEYGDMQLIAEASHLCRSVGGLSPAELSRLLTSLNAGPLGSFLMEVTATLYKKKDELGGDLAAGGSNGASRNGATTANGVSSNGVSSTNYQIDSILDSAGSKGTGKWTIQQSAELGVPCSTMAAALEARYLSALKPQRVAAAALDRSGAVHASPPPGWEQALEDALLASKLCSYAQGMALIAAASDANGWNLTLATLASIWRGGCIIRAEVLSLVRAAFERDPRLPNLLLDPEVARVIGKRTAGWRRIVALCVERGIPIPALSASLAYYDSFRSETLHSAQCIQAQRDYFGGHGFKRVDREGNFHVKWEES